MTSATTMPPIPDRHFANLQSLEGGYWWFVGRLHWVRRWITDWAGTRDLSRCVLADVGCGTGGMARELRKLGFGSVFLVESSPDALSRLHGLPPAFQLFPTDFTRGIRFPSAPDVITCLDVLEHVERDEDALRQLASALAPGGLLLVTVPAHPALYSEWDRGLGHYRRYRLRDLVARVRAAGLKPLRWSGMWAPLLPAAPYRLVSPRRQQTLEFPNVPPWLNRLLGALAVAEERVARRFAIPVGTSFILAATK